MTIISKAALAAEIGVTKPRISQYLARGLPVRGDGKLDREAALNWLAANQRSGFDHRKGPARARALSANATPPARSLGEGEAVRRALVGFASQVAFYVAHNAVDLGIPLRLAFALTAEVAAGLDDVAAELLQRVGLPHPGRLVSGSAAMAPDWTTLADRAGERVDLTAWKAFQAEAVAKLYAAEPEGIDPTPSDPIPEP